MAEVSPINFKDKSISQLVAQLNSLGDDHVAIHPTTLIAIQDCQSESIRRFRSRSMHKSRNSTSRTAQKVTQCQFFLADGSQKKYYYKQIANELQNGIISTIMSKFQQNFNTTIVMQYTPHHFQLLINKIRPWFEQNQDNIFLAFFLQYRVREAIDLLSGSVPKSMPLSQAVQKDQQFYEVTINQILKPSNHFQQNNIKILKLMNRDMAAQLRIVLLPPTIMNPQIDDAGVKIVKSQLTQILNYIKTYPNKKYQNINKLLPKRYPTTTAIAEILLYDSANFIINWVTQNAQNKPLVNGRFDFYDHFTGIKNLIKKTPNISSQVRVVKKSKSISSMQRNSLTSKSPRNARSRNKQQKQNEIDETKTKTVIYGPQQSRTSQQQSQLQFCRTFQRKTHKYSVDEMTEERLFPQIDNFNPNLNESETVAIMKAQHARQISQYHSTIQNLNQKILILTSQKGLSELYTIHERQIMLLQLKIEQLRKDISVLSSKANGPKQNQNLKAMVKKLNEEISHHQKNNPTHKLAQGKIKMLEKELSELRCKHQKSEQARQQLTQQLQNMTKRLHIKDEQCGNLKQKQIEKFNEDDLAAKDRNTFKEIKEILQQGVNKDSISHVLRKVKNILGDLSQVREIVLECNNFLVDLQDHLQCRLSQKDPDVVMDCNRFIRSYLLQNLNIL